MSILMFHSLSANDSIIKKMIDKILPNETFIYKNFSFINAFKRSVYINQESHISSYNFYEDIKNNKLKKRYFLDSFYFYSIVKILYGRKIRNIEINQSLINKYINNLNFLTKFFVKCYICWKVSYKLEFSNKSAKKVIFFNSKDKFSKKLYENNIQKYFKNYQLASIKNNLNFVEKGLIFLKNLKVCVLKSYPTKNFHILILYMKYDMFQNLVDSYKINKGIFFEGDSPDDDLMSGYLRNKKIKTYLFQQGTYFEKKVPVFFKNLNYDYFLCWGDFFKDRIQKHNPKLKIFSVGRIGRNYIKKNKKKIIIFADQNHPSNGTQLIIKNKFYDLCEWCINNLKDYKIILKPHPKYEVSKRAIKLKQYKNFSLASNSDDITKYLVDAQFLIAISSTALLDALAYNVIPISFMPNLSMQPNLKKNKIGIVANSLFHSKKILSKITQSEILSKKLLLNNKNEYYIKRGFDNNFKNIVKGI